MEQEEYDPQFDEFGRPLKRPLPEIITALDLWREEKERQAFLQDYGLE